VTGGRHRLTVDVSDVAPAGARALAGDLFLPAERLDPPIVMVCLPGGGMTRRYFDIEVAGDDGTYSMARHLADRGIAVVTLDPPGVGESDAPEDGWSLTAPVVGAVCAHAARQIIDELRAGPLPGAVSIGVGHSAGALLAVYAQASSSCFDALGLLGFAGGGLPSALSAEERALAGDAERAHREVVGLARARFGRPFPAGTTGPSALLLGVPVPDAARAGITAAGGALLAVVGLTSMLPGASAPELAAIEVPVFLGVGDLDITGAPRAIPAQFPRSGDISLYVLGSSGHNHNVAPTRHQLWDRLRRWAISISTAGASAAP
jgi:pimeloyl-ACP methyl ester carboxylesterase